MLLHTAYIAAITRSPQPGARARRGVQLQAYRSQRRTTSGTTSVLEPAARPTTSSSPSAAQEAPQQSSDAAPGPFAGALNWAGWWQQLDVRTKVVLACSSGFMLSNMGEGQAR